MAEGKIKFAYQIRVSVSCYDAIKDLVQSTSQDNQLLTN